MQVLPDSAAGAALLIADLARVADAPAAALALLVDRLALRSAVLRGPDAALLAVAGTAVDAVPASRQTPPEPGARAVELPGTGCTLTVAGADDADLPLLVAAATVLALGLRAGLAPDLLRDEDADRDALADALHDGPVQVLVAARYACDAAVRGGDPAVARDAVQEAVVALRRTLWQLRPRPSSSLSGALEGLAASQVEAGGPALALTAVDQAALDAAPRALAYRLVQALLRTGPVTVTGAPGHLLLQAAGPLPDADRWARRCRSLGASLVPGPDGLRLHAPAPAPTSAPTPETKACS